MPTKPTVAEKIEPTKKAMARPHQNASGRPDALAAKYRSDGDQEDQHADDAELAVEIGVGPFADRPAAISCIFFGALGGLHDLPDQHQGVGQAAQGDDDVEAEEELFQMLNFSPNSGSKSKTPPTNHPLECTAGATAPPPVAAGLRWPSSAIADTMPTQTNISQAVYRRLFSRLRGFWPAFSRLTTSFHGDSSFGIRL